MWHPSSTLTDGHTAVRAAEVDVALGDGCHANLVKARVKKAAKVLQKGTVLSRWRSPRQCSPGVRADGFSAARGGQEAQDFSGPPPGRECFVILVTVNSPLMQVIRCT